MPSETVAQKARVRPGTTIAVSNPVPGVVESLGLPDDVAFVGAAKAELVFVFARTREELERRMRSAVSTLAPSAALWVFFQKGSTAAGRSMNRNDVWAAAEQLGMRPLGLVSVDDTWSVFRFRRAT